MRRILGSVGGIIVVALIIVGLFFGGWWVYQYSISRSAEIRRNQFEIQKTDRDEMLRQAVQIEGIDVQLANPTLSDDQKAALKGQRQAMVTQLCNVASSITGTVSAAIDNAVRTYCGYSPSG